MEPSLQFEEGIEETVKWYLENQEWMDNVTSGDYQKYYYYYVVNNDELLAIKDTLQKELKHLGLWKFARAVMYVLHEALGLSEEKMIAPMDEKRGKLLLEEILNGGNFGRHFTKYGHFTQQGMAKKYFLKIWRNMHFVRYYPAEALSEPIFRTWHFFWRLKHRR